LHSGELALVWLAYILSASDHCKVGLEEWASRRLLMINALLGRPAFQKDFCDDSLARLLERLSRDANWEAIESGLWSATIEVYDLPISGVRLDTTTCAGYHEMTEAGVMQLGHSKQHRPDLPQLKLMAGTVEGFGHIIATDVVPGNSADDPLYTPLIQRVRKTLQKQGLLYTGDCKMASLPTRAELAAHQDMYLIPLPLTGTTPDELEEWITQAENGTRPLTVIREAGEEIARGYELERELADRQLQWTERVLIVRSKSFAEAKAHSLDERLYKAVEEVQKLTPPPARGKRQIRDEATLQSALKDLMQKWQVVGLLHVTWQRQETSVTKYKGKGRGSAHRERVIRTTVRYVITGVECREEAVGRAKYRLGWRAFVTNANRAVMSLECAVLHYRNGYKSIERQFDLLRNRPLGLSPLYVRKDSQIIGLTRLLTVALRMMTLVEMVMQDALRSKKLSLKGLSRGQPTRSTDMPTGQAILKALARTEMTLYVISEDKSGKTYCSTTELPGHLGLVLQCMGVPQAVYEAPLYERTQKKIAPQRN
jgi:transposase